jgi:hypothetical protein
LPKGDDIKQMGRKITALTVLFFVVSFVLFTNISTAQDTGSYWDVGQEMSYDGDSIIARIIAGLLLAPINFFINIIGLQDPVTLIFGIEPEGVRLRKFIPYEDLILYTFTEQQFGAVSRFFDSARGFLLPLLVVALVIVAALTATRALGFGGSSRERAEVKDLLTGVVVFFASIAVLPTLLRLLFGINWLLVKFAASVVDPDILKRGFLHMIPEASGYSLGSVIIALLFIFSIGLLNFQYNLRLLALGILILLFPFAAFISVFPARRGTISMWFSQLWSNLLLQPAHAFIFAFFVAFAGADPGFWLLMALYVGLNTMTILVRQVFGGESGGIGSSISSIVGISALTGLAGMAVRAARHGGLLKTIRKETDDIEDALRDRPGEILSSQRTSGSAAGTAQTAASSVSSTAGAALAGSVSSPSINIHDRYVPMKRKLGTARAYRIAGRTVKNLATAYGALMGAAALGTFTGAAFGDASSGMQYGGLGGMLTGSRLGSIPQNWFDVSADIYEEGFADKKTINEMTAGMTKEEKEAFEAKFSFQGKRGRRYGIFDYGVQIMDPEEASKIGARMAGVPGAVLWRGSSLYHRIKARTDPKTRPNLEKATDTRKKVEETSMMAAQDAQAFKQLKNAAELLERRAAAERLKGDTARAEETERYLQAYREAMLKKQTQLSERYALLHELGQKHGIIPYAHYGVDASLDRISR